MAPIGCSSSSTTFEIHLPSTAEVPETWDEAEEPAPAVPRGSETILIVEDEPPLRELLRCTLEFHGYKVLEAESGRAALVLWQEHSRSIDLLLTDIVMPGGLTGWELAEFVKAERPQLKVLLTSGCNKEIDAQGSAHRKGFHFVPKPYRPLEVARASATVSMADPTRLLCSQK